MYRLFILTLLSAVFAPIFSLTTAYSASVRLLDTDFAREIVVEKIGYQNDYYEISISDLIDNGVTPDYRLTGKDLDWVFSITYREAMSHELTCKPVFQGRERVAAAMFGAANIALLLCESLFFHTQADVASLAVYGLITLPSVLALYKDRVTLLDIRGRIHQAYGHEKMENIEFIDAATFAYLAQNIRDTYERLHDRPIGPMGD